MRFTGSTLRKRALRRRSRNPWAVVILASTALACTPAPATGAPGGNALETLNHFLSESAASTPAYRADLQRNADPAHVPDGRLSGFSPLIGPFTYRPKTYAELTPPERVELLRDGRFHDYLLRRGRPFQINPEDMLKPQPIVVQLNAP